MLSGLVTPTSGHISWLDPYGCVVPPGRVGVVPQSTALPPHLTVKETLTYFATMQGLEAVPAHVCR